MYKRGIPLLLTLVLLLALLPARASATETKADKLQEQVKSTYRSALYHSGKRSFNGYCGALVSWQTYLLGIDTQRYNRNGKDQYDQYSGMNVTTGGYRVRSYSAKEYQLRSALQAITKKGTADAYNLLVGFQRTNTAEGSIYGHAVFIHGIVGGNVYFTECFSTTIDGQYWPEGTTISCSLDTFCDYYNSWTTFEGVIYFGKKNYADECSQYPASMYAMARENVPIYAEPVDALDAAAADKLTDESLTAGQIVMITALLQTPGGSYWYALNSGDGFVPAEKMEYVASAQDDLILTNFQAPTTLIQGRGFSLGGRVVASYSGLTNVTVQVYPVSDPATPVFSVQTQGENGQVNLSAEAFEKGLSFSQLPEGEYGISIKAQTQGYALNQGQPQVQTWEETLWTSQFRVIPQWGNYATVTFDGNGGMLSLQQQSVSVGESLESLPVPAIPGEQILGWSTDPDGFQPVELPLVIEGDTVLYAQWGPDLYQAMGWQLVYDNWQYCYEGVPVEGWFPFADMKFYQLASGIIVRGWREIDGVEYYFSETGVLLSGWQEISGSRYYLFEEGGKAVGRVFLDGMICLFDEEGRLLGQEENTDENASLLNHSWDEGTVTKEPAFGEPGEKIYRCSVCSRERTEEIPALTFFQAPPWWGILLMVLGGVAVLGGGGFAGLLLWRRWKAGRQEEEPETVEQE